MALAWLAVGAGGLLAGASLWQKGRSALPAGAVAGVGSHNIAREQWLRAVAAVEGDRGVPLDAPARRAILQRLIDEELLYQHALDSGLARDDPGLRKTLIAGVVEAVTSGGAVDEVAARRLFEQDPAYFAALPRLRVSGVEHVSGPAPDGASLKAALKGGALPAGLRPLALPTSAIPLSQLAQQLGGGMTEVLRRNAVGQPIGPLPRGSGPLYLMIHERQADAPRYEEVADAVRSEWSRREAEAALAQLLVALRKAATIRVADDAD